MTTFSLKSKSGLSAKLIALYQKRLAKYLKNHTERIEFGIIFLELALLFVLFDQFVKSADRFIQVGELLYLLSEFLANLSIELVGIAVTVLVIDFWSEIRQEEQLKAALIRDLGSTDNNRAIKAAIELRVNDWLCDGSLKKAPLTKANLAGADLSKACLKNAQLIGANLKDAVLDEAVLINANLLNSNLRRASLEGANLENAILGDVQKVVGFPGIIRPIGQSGSADLTQANLDSANLGGATLHNVKLIDAVLTRANLKGANLKGANLRQAFLMGANLKGACLRGEKAVGGSPIAATMIPVAGNQKDANLEGAYYDESTVWPDDLDVQETGAKLLPFTGPFEDGSYKETVDYYRKNRDKSRSCTSCGHSLQLSSSSYTINRNGYHLIIDNVPAWVCDHCYSSIFDEETVSSFQPISEELDRQFKKSDTD